MVGVRLTHPPWFVNINVTEEEAYRILLGLVADAHPKVREAVAHDLGDIRSPDLGAGAQPNFCLLGIGGLAMVLEQVGRRCGTAETHRESWTR